MVAPKVKAVAGEVKAKVDKTVLKSILNTLALKYDQTLGSPLTKEETTALLAHDLESYTELYSPLGGQVASVIDSFPNIKAPTGEIHLFYQDPKLGRQDIRVRITYSDMSKFQQIIIGKESSMNTFTTNDFFDSLDVGYGYVGTTDSILKQWDLMRPPMDLFTLYFPKPSPPYMEESPKTRSTEKTERIWFTFHDPIWNQDILLRVYGFELDRALDYPNTVAFLKENFIKKQRFTADGIGFVQDKKGGAYTVGCMYSIIPPDGYSYIDTVRLHAIFRLNYMMVFEVRSSKRLKNTSLIDSIIDLAQFTPNDARLLRLQKEKRKRMAEEEARKQKSP